jgi:hypothetical protein
MGETGKLCRSLQKRVLNLTALKMEAAAIARQFKLRAPRGSERVELLVRRFPSDLYVIGIGAIRMPDLSGRPIAGIMMAGLAGGLDPSLAKGDIVVDQESTWKMSRIPHRRARFHTADRVICKAKDKAQLFADTGAAVVEMEGEKVRRSAGQYSLPYLGIRAISDCADESIDPKILKFIDPFGRPRIGEVIGELFKHPSILGRLRRLSRDSGEALEKLAVAVKQIIDPPE